MFLDFLLALACLENLYSVGRGFRGFPAAPSSEERPRWISVVKGNIVSDSQPAGGGRVPYPLSTRLALRADSRPVLQSTEVCTVG